MSGTLYILQRGEGGGEGGVWVRKNIKLTSFYPPPPSFFYTEVKTTLANRKPRLSMKEIIRKVDPIEDFESNLPRSAEEKATNRDHPGCVVQARSSHGHLGV